MNLLTFTIKSMLHRKWVLLFAFFSILISYTLVVTIQAAALGVREALIQEASSYEMVIGAEGSATQLVLNSLMRMEVPLGNIPFSLYDTLKRDKRIMAAIPIGLGDSYGGIPIIGTTADYFRPFRSGMQERYHLREGAWFTKEGEIVAGAEAARRLGLTLGKTFYGNHGIHEEGESHEQLRYKVVGILNRAGNADDQALFTPMESLWAVHGETDSAKREITAILIKPIQMGYLPKLKEELDARNGVQAAYVTPVFRQLLGMAEQVGSLLTFISYVTLALTVLFLFFLLLSVAVQRRGEWALLRVLGIRKRMIFLHLLLEPFFLIGGGIIGGWVLSFFLSFLLSRYTLREYGLPLPLMIGEMNQWLFTLCLILLGIFLSITPYLELFRRKGMGWEILARE